MVNDEFGLKLIYPSSTTNEQYLSFPKSLNVLNQSGILQKKVPVSGTFTVNAVSDTIFWYEFTPKNNNNRRIFILPSSLTIGSNGNLEMDVNCEMNHTEAHDRGYTNDSGEWQNVEMTSWFFAKTVSSSGGYIFLEARVGKGGDEDGGCCQDTGYEVRLFLDQGATKGKFDFTKTHFTGAAERLPEQSQTVVSTFYQKWFGVKFIIYNTAAERVRLELWLTNVDFLAPSSAISNAWTKVGEVEDYRGKGWGRGGKDCDAPTDDYPITWAAPLISFGWVGADVVQFMNTSFREIDKDGTFGQDPPPPEPPSNFPDPTIPDPDPDPPTTPDPQPPDAEPGQTPTTLTRRLTLRREVINNRMCSCDGIQQPDDNPVPPDPPPGGGGGGGGTGTLSQMYNVALNTSGFATLSTVSGSSSHYLRFGQAVTQTSSSWLNKSINRVEITIGKQGSPSGGTGGGIHCRIRKGADDSIAATLTPIVAPNDVTTEGKLFVFENLTNTYKLVFNDKLLFEFDGGDANNYIKIFRTTQPTTTGTKIMWRTNNMDPGEYDDAPDLDLCARVFTLTP
jgi:hypothetical protein